MTDDNWLGKLVKIKTFWASRYVECENDEQRAKVKETFASDLAGLYGGSSTDPDIIEEVNLELDS